MRQNHFFGAEETPPRPLDLLRLTRGDRGRGRRRPAPAHRAQIANAGTYHSARMDI